MDLILVYRILDSFPLGLGLLEMMVEKTGTKSVVSMLAVGLLQMRLLPPLVQVQVATMRSTRKKPRVVQVRLLSALLAASWNHK
jgi:ACR3 family arsenite efflux pump ArsB